MAAKRNSADPRAESIGERNITEHLVLLHFRNVRSNALLRPHGHSGVPLYLKYMYVNANLQHISTQLCNAFMRFTEEEMPKPKGCFHEADLMTKTVLKENG